MSDKKHYSHLMLTDPISNIDSDLHSVQLHKGYLLGTLYVSEAFRYHCVSEKFLPFKRNCRS